MHVFFNVEFSVFYLQITCVLACDGVCPTDKPYCSEVGCVFQCPEPFYINGTNCISDCGDWFVDEHRHCREECPPNTYYKESLKQIPWRHYLERKCVRCSQYNEYISNEACINVCPENSRHLDQKHCSTDCPSDRQFKMNITLFGLLHYKCTDECPSLSDNSFCTYSCPEMKLIFNSSCVEECPLTHPFMFSKTCMKECTPYTSSAGLDNKTCVYTCPVEQPFVVNKTCVDKCSNRTLFITTNNGFRHCVESCGDGKYEYMTNCLERCPPATVAVNNSCIKHCPNENPLSCMIEKGNNCGQGQKHGLDHSVCVARCPQNMLLWNSTCVYSCPPGILSLVGECAEYCPVDKPYTNNITSGDDCTGYSQVFCKQVQNSTTCVNKCPSDKYVYNNTCLTYCLYPLVTKDHMCITNCPITDPFVQSSTRTIKTWLYDTDYMDYEQIKQSVEVLVCVPACKQGLAVLNLICVSSCPEDYPFIHNQTCSKDSCTTRYVANTAIGITCFDHCKIGEYGINNSCVKHCPDTHFIFNDTCVDLCPDSHVYNTDYVVGETCSYGSCSARVTFKQCVEKCPNDSFLYQNACLNICDKPLLTYENECLVSCPPAAPYTVPTSILVATRNSDGTVMKESNVRKTIVKCAATCAYDKALLGTNCTDNCPFKKRYITNGTCDSTPCNTKYRHYITPGIKCVEECQDNMFVKNITCVLECPKHQYIYRQTCVPTCPGTHTLVSDETIVKAMFNCSQLGIVCAESVIHVRQCRNECPEDKFIYNNTCVEYCPHNTSIFSNTCVPSCPRSLPYTHPSHTAVERWKQDKPYIWHLNNEQYNVTQCTLDCTKDYPYRSGYTCVASCPETDRYSLNTTCVSKCPGDKLTDMRSRQCIDKCSGEQLFRVDECIRSDECAYPMFAFDILCVRTCPAGYVWYASCWNRLKITVAIAALGVVLALLGFWSRTTVPDFLRILTWINISEVGYLLLIYYNYLREQMPFTVSLVLIPVDLSFEWLGPYLCFIVVSLQRMLLPLL